MINVNNLPGFIIDGPFLNASRDKFSYLIGHSNDFSTVLDLGPELVRDDNFWYGVEDQLKTLLFNHIGFERRTYNSKQEIIEFINNHFPRLNPEIKLLSILEYLHSLTKFDGDTISLSKYELEEKNVWRLLFLNHSQELEFYINNIKGVYIDFDDTSDTYIGLHLTLNGLTKIGEYLESKKSNICFVAMSFDESLNVVYDQGIEPAIIESGFRPLIIRKEHIESSLTINDAIIADIKKAHFTIADFTFHKAGVYFEAGYALGRGQKVIYLCREDEIASAHFDTRNYQHIVWREAEDLRKKLISKIEAFIKN